MRVFNKKSQLERMLEGVTDSLDVPGNMKFELPSGGSGKALKVGLITAGGLAGLTAASTAVSSLRRQSERAGGQSEEAGEGS